MPLRVTSRGDWRRTEAWLKRLKDQEIFAVLDKYGSMGVAALSAATPVEHGKTASSWYYEVVHKQGYHSIRWFNSHVEQPGNRQIAILLQYGHGTGTGGYVQGRDYINPAIRPIFDQIEAEVRKAVTK